MTYLNVLKCLDVAYGEPHPFEARDKMPSESSVVEVRKLYIFETCKYMVIIAI